MTEPQSKVPRVAGPVPPGDTEAEPPVAPASSTPDAMISRDVGRSYWEGAKADVDGMLGGVTSVGGFSQISKIDLQGSRSFLAKLGIGARQGRRKLGSALEGGAGVGRITVGVLLNVAEHVDVVEPVARFTDPLRGRPGVRNIFNVGLEEWQPPDGQEYDLIWTQWCVGHLTDSQLVQYLEVCRTVLSPDGGVIVVKENLSTGSGDMFDETDSSVTREDSKFHSLFKQAGLQIVKTELQKGFPKGLFPVRLYALRSATLSRPR